MSQNAGAQPATTASATSSADACTTESAKVSAKVSTIVPVYNGAQWLSSTLESLLAQTYDNHEIVLVDDGSTDDSPALIATYANNPQVTVVQQSNGGVAAARNAGIKAASGELLAFCDQDDLWMPDKLAKQVPLFSESVGLVYSGVEFRYPDLARRVIPSGPPATFDKLLTKNFISSCTAIARRTAVETVNLLDADRALMGVDDWHLWLKLLTVTGAAYVPEVLAVHIVHGNNYSFQETAMMNASLACLDKLAIDPALKGRQGDLKIARREVYDHYAQNFIHYGQFAEARNCLINRFKLEPQNTAVLLRLMVFGLVPYPVLRGLQRLKRRTQGPVKTQ